ncbi:MAG: DUF6470 family protein [Oscillospiraceae bacterium]|jgi:hypothetical protein|nr:DUF6470 family protein [Oscillospiraceae bacterium]
MTISRLVIDQQFAQLGVKFTPAQMTVSTNIVAPEIDTETSKPKIDSEVPAFTLNFSKLMSDVGVATPSEATDQYAGKGLDTSIQGTQVAANDGDYLASTDKPGDRVAQIAKQHNRPKMPETNVASIPKAPPQITWSKGSVNINWSDHNVNIDWNSNYLPEIKIDPRASVEVYLRNQPKITISVEESQPFEARYINEKL